MEWLWRNGYGSTELLAGDMQRTYAEVCRELNWAVRPWNPVARELTRLTTGRKVYRWIVRDDMRHRLRVYLVPTPDMLRADAIDDRSCEIPFPQPKQSKARARKTSFSVFEVTRPLSARRRAHGRQN